jgi:hypothetical protein
MKLKQFIRRIFSELYHWQNDLYGKENLPGFTALLAISSLQFLNILSVFMIIENITRVELASFFGHHLILGLIIPVGLLIMDYLIIKPIDLTIEEYPSKKTKITWIYVLITLLVLAGCIAWIVILNNKRGI